MLKQKFLVHFGSKIFISILATISGIFVARLAGPEVMGTISYATAYVSIFGFISGLFGSAHIKMISEGQDVGDCLATYTRLQLSSIFVYFIVVVVFCIFQTQVLHKTFDAEDQITVIFIVLIATILSKFLEFNEVTFTAQLMQAKSNLPGVLKSILFQLGRIVIVVLGFKAVALASWNLLTSLVLLPVVYFYLKQLPFGNYNSELAKKYIAYSIPLFIIVLINSLSAHLGKIFLTDFSSARELGYYSAANVFSSKITLIGNSIGMIFFPYFSKVLANNDWHSVNHKIFTYQRFLSTFLFPFICVMFIVARPMIILVLGREYVASVQPFLILMLSSYVFIMGMPYGNVITGMGKFYLNMWLKAINFLIFFLALVFLLSPTFLGLQSVGLSISMLILNVSYCLISIIAARKVGSVKLDTTNIVRYTVLSVYTLIFMSIKEVFLTDKVWHLSIAAIIFLILAYSLMYVMRLMTKEQLAELQEILKLQKLLSYIKHELFHYK